MLEDAWVKNMAGKPHYIILRQHIMQVSRNCLYNYALHTEDLSYESYYYYYCYYYHTKTTIINITTIIIEQSRMSQVISIVER